VHDICKLYRMLHIKRNSISSFEVFRFFILNDFKTWDFKVLK